MKKMISSRPTPPFNQQPHTSNWARCRKAVARIEKVKAAVLSEFHDVLAEYQHLLHLAVNEAEALAWQTDFPHLFFPTLATEKANAVADWQARQQFVRRTRPLPALAA